MIRKITDKQIEDKLRQAFRNLRDLEDKLECIASDPKSSSAYAKQAKEKLSAAFYELNFIYDELDKD